MNPLASPMVYFVARLSWSDRSLLSVAASTCGIPHTTWLCIYKFPLVLETPPTFMFHPSSLSGNNSSPCYLFFPPARLASRPVSNVLGYETTELDLIIHQHVQYCCHDSRQREDTPSTVTASVAKLDKHCTDASADDSESRLPYPSWFDEFIII